MSVQDIVKYVRQTPGNTNPSVIASMVESEIRQNSSNSNVNSDWAENNPESPSFIKNRTHYTTGYSFDFNGVLEGKEHYDMSAIMPDFYLVKVNDKPYTKEELIGSKLTVVIATNGDNIVENDLEVTEENIGYFEDMESIVCLFLGSYPLVISISEVLPDIPPIGLYFLYAENIEEVEKIYVSKFTKEEVIKIDEKYLPFTSEDIREIKYNTDVVNYNVKKLDKYNYISSYTVNFGAGRTEYKQMIGVIDNCIIQLQTPPDEGDKTYYIDFYSTGTLMAQIYCKPMATNTDKYMKIEIESYGNFYLKKITYTELTNLNNTILYQLPQIIEGRFNEIGIRCEQGIPDGIKLQVWRANE